MSIRKEVEQILKTDWADIPALAGVRIIASERALDTLDVPTALIRLKRIEREPSAPLASRRFHLLLTLISEHVDMDMAGDDLEELTAEALDYLGTKFLHEPAEIVGYADRLAADIPLIVIASPEAPQPEEA